MTQLEKNDMYIHRVESALAESPTAMNYFKKLIAENDIRHTTSLKLSLDIQI